MDKFEPIDESLDRLNEILNREISNLNSSKQENHKAWDSHILTLSTASIGFTFGYLPLKGSDYLCLALLALAFFIISIIASITAYLYTDRGLESQTDDHITRRTLTQEAIHLHSDFKQSHIGNESLSNNDISDHKSNIHKIFQKRDGKAHDLRVDYFNKLIFILNHGKTYSFILGVTLITIFASINFLQLGG